MRIGVLAYQGGVYEHEYMLRRAFTELGVNGDVVLVKKPNQLREIDGVIIPGGESTTIGRLAERFGVLDLLRDLIKEGLPAFGTCAGAIMMAKKVRDSVVGEVQQPVLGVMDVEIVRNYYGRQRDSFEIDLSIPTLGEEPFRGVFIRAPAIVKLWNDAEPLAKLEGVTVLARQKNMLASTFHPELSGDTRLHKLFIEELVKK
ncbi:MAG: pyridoxal 5'-phosphate synthase glutaminase subunit PdxT [Thermoprotei archaeon]|nr:MAG: pyridoxal 5'-phosphate synthase glutaminase subunit PdxT [Thermoprotei archaeon]